MVQILTNCNFWQIWRKIVDSLFYKQCASIWTTFKFFESTVIPVLSLGHRFYNHSEKTQISNHNSRILELHLKCMRLFLYSPPYMHSLKSLHKNRVNVHVLWQDFNEQTALKAKFATAPKNRKVFFMIETINLFSFFTYLKFSWFEDS